MPKLGIFEEYKNLCTPIIWIGFSLWFAYNFVVPIIVQFSWILLANVAFWMIFLAAYLKVWWYKTPFKGLHINVREPHVGFAKMDWDFDVSDIGQNIFGAAFGWHLSAVLVPAESSIHMFMGNDIQRAAVDGDNTSCIGMMTQEMNHGIAQLFLSRGCEKSIGYPIGYRQLWKIVLIKIFSIKFKAAFFMWFEIFSSVFHIVYAMTPIKTKNLFGKPYWLWSYHLMEEMEHSWDFVEDIRPRLPWIYRLAWYLISFPLMIFLWTQGFLQGLWYGKETCWQNPSKLVTSVVVYFVVWIEIMLFVLALSFMEMILGMRPDQLYVRSKKGMSDDFDEFKHHFKITHTQSPEEEALKKCEGVPPPSSISGIKEARENLYDGVRDMMRENGQSEKEIKRTSFTMAAESNKFNPLLQ